MRRLPDGSRIARAAPVAFTWEGRPMQGLAGDTLASALLANGVRVVGRSFKYHRPRGIFGAWAEEPNAILDLSWQDRAGIARHDPNARATMVELLPGMAARGVNGWPSVERDVYGLIDLAHRFLPAGFYYKTFMAPDWHRYEPGIRRMAGLGRLHDSADPLRYETRHAHCDVLVVGGGPAGIAAARAAAASGLRVMLVDDRAAWGGSLLWQGGTIDDRPATEWVADSIAGLAEATLLPRTTVFGWYDHNALGLLERRTAAAAGWAEDRLWHVRARQVVLATGAIERPLVFPDNDRPGVMSAAAVLQYLREYAVLAGERVLVATNNDTAYDTVLALCAAGAAVTVADARTDPGPAARRAAEAGARIRAGSVVAGVGGRRGIRWAEVAPLASLSTRERLPADLVAVSGGWSPAVHLFSQSGGKLRWDEAEAAFLPATPRPGQHLAGALAGAASLAACLAGGHRAGLAAARALDRHVDLAPPRAPDTPAPAPIQALWHLPLRGTRQWIDFQNDVTVKDVALAAAENYASVEHLKRYTTLGMATDQGKTSNVNGLAALAAFTGREIPQVGTTTFRPPFVPVSLGAMAGLRHSALHTPIRHLPAHAEHLADGAEMREYGVWLRPACYPRAGETVAQAIQREAAAVRTQAGLFDGSSLGKIEVHGPDAAAFLNLIYYNEVATLKPGRIRYCLLLRETGTVLDDGVVARIAPDRYLLSPSSSHTGAVLAMLELWHQTEYPSLRVAFHDVTAAWATLAVSGPRSRDILRRLHTGIDLSDAALAHMSLAHGTIEDLPGRIARVSFTGERSYEISVPAGYGAALWQHLLTLGRDDGITPYGIESLSVLRAEKGYILIGTDSDGMTLPDDLGMSGPLRAKKVDFVGKRSLLTPDATRPDRRQFVGLLPADPGFVPAVGTHAVVQEGGARRSIGWITTSAHSPALGRSIALGMIERGRALADAGAEVELFHLGQASRAVVTAPCFHDPAGEKLHG
ncbi:sarcosine oxidase subunit alpha family protein [Limobrevibacterium gyesilva]|uniref:Sarcosine oxidase subunit alpha family protein n=1 Tax=Limobrevibacterium gyesilva TaxID=2991712 RepID=A0AA42CDU5_9PROT|nr:sarcosine oxidase subunit alpha family protein [Limobrevibacterium gyesilva]MCW3474379.1 sarcosine oxidase subunit alpha family protein [Limobrevibacterium gyesilva]